VYRHKDGTPIPAEKLEFEVVAGGDGTGGRGGVLVRDLTERRAFERQLLQSGKLAAIGELAAGVAHEINNPLFAILGLVEFLLKDAEEGTKSHERLQLVQQTGLEIKEIVKALLDFARERTDEHGPMVVRDVVADAVSLLRKTSSAKAVEIVERSCDASTEIVGSANQIKQVLLNLVSNAQQAMPDGGTITIDVAADDEAVTVTVSDTGPGIPEDVLPRIFDPFFTTKRDVGGTGLGLAVSHGIAEMHGGSLGAESMPGAGAAFALRLPREGGTS
jgi:two-component system NtrC family sensor kinase